MRSCNQLLPHISYRHNLSTPLILLKAPLSRARIHQSFPAICLHSYTSSSQLSELQSVTECSQRSYAYTRPLTPEAFKLPLGSVQITPWKRLNYPLEAFKLSPRSVQIIPPKRLNYPPMPYCPTGEGRLRDECKQTSYCLHCATLS